MKKLLFIPILAIATVFSLTATPASAATPPDSCFATTGVATKTITDYYDNEGNNPANPACPRDVDIPSTIGGVVVTGIGSSAFQFNDLTSVTIPNSVTSIGSSAFYFNNLTSVNIPNSVTSIGANAFLSNRLTSVTILNASASMQHTSFSSNPVSSMVIGSTTYTAQVPTTSAACFVLVGTTLTDYRDNSPLIARNDGFLCGSSVAIPDGVTHIGSAAFDQNHLTDVILPDTVVSIGSSAFTSNNLTAVKLSNTLTSIGRNAFQGNEFTEIDLPESLMTIEDYAFHFNKLAHITIPDSVTSIGDGAFSYGELISVDLGDSLATIGEEAFSRNNIESVTIPNEVTHIEQWAFASNYIDELIIGDSVTDISAFAFVLNKIENSILPDSVVVLHSSAFGLQNPWGREMADCTSDAECIWTSVFADAKAAQDSIWYTQLYTANSNNPNSLMDGVMSEYHYSWGEDLIANGLDDSLGGHIINPASATINYRNATNTSLQQSLTFAGLVDNTTIQDYLVKNGPTIPQPTDPENPTPEETQAIQDALSAYYRIGDEVTITPPAIDGYITPPAQTFVLSAATNEIVYTYETSQPTTGALPSDDKELAETGMSMNMILLFATSMVVVGASLGLSHKLMIGSER